MTILHHVDPEEFLVDSFRLGKKVYRSGFRPKHMLSIWRGGTPVGLGVDAFFRSRGVQIHHTTIATDSYTGIGRRGGVTVKNLDHLVQVICPEDGLLIIDDVYESGNTIRQVVELLRHKARANAPTEIVVATVHHKPGCQEYGELPIIALHEVAANVWIDYPHELADLVDPEDPEDSRIRGKGEDIWSVLRGGAVDPVPMKIEGGFHYVRPREFLLDCVQLGINVAGDETWRPDFLIALWPGGVMSGLPVHEVFKYVFKTRGPAGHVLDHISLNTSPTRSTYRTDVVGIQYLADHIDSHHNVLIIDSAFRAGLLVNDVIHRLRDTLRCNLDPDRVRVATVYYNPEHHSTGTIHPAVTRPHYYLKQVDGMVIGPTNVHQLPDPRQQLRDFDPELWNVLYDD
jgi:hypothetical protein